MSRTDDDIIKQIKELIESHVKPSVAQHGGNIEFVDYKEGNLLLELGGACSGCAGSTITLKMGVENMLKHYIPEIQTVEAQDGFSDVDPFYSDPYAMSFYDRMEGPDGEFDN
jgi:Fe-S cluster biogenesis protein NfuA|tara:strand:+ start:75 stop:410 length:336 start_codon:yes stop_codon:yes gene_type:complete